MALRNGEARFDLKKHATTAAQVNLDVVNRGISLQTNGDRNRCLIWGNSPIGSGRPASPNDTSKPRRNRRPEVAAQFVGGATYGTSGGACLSRSWMLATSKFTLAVVGSIRCGGGDGDNAAILQPGPRD